MKQRKMDALRVALAHWMRDGERVELAGLAMVGNISTTRVMAQAFATFTVPKPLYVALTDQRLLFVEPSATSGRPTSNVVAEVSRTALACGGTRIRKIMFMFPALIVDLAITGNPTGLSLTFRGGYRADGRQIAGALPASLPDPGAGIGQWQDGAVAQGAVPAGAGAGRRGPARIIKAVIGVVLTGVFIAGGIGEMSIGNTGGAVLTFVVAAVTAGYAVLVWNFRWSWLLGPRPGKRTG